MHALYSKVAATSTAARSRKHQLKRAVAAADMYARLSPKAKSKSSEATKAKAVGVIGHMVEGLIRKLVLKYAFLLPT